MLNPSRLFSLMGVLLFSLFTASIAGAAYADPPGRVAHLSHTQGEVSYSPAGEDEWFGVVRNRPLIRGDRLWSDRDARAEFQVGSAAVRLGANTSVEILDLSDQIAQVRLTQGTLNLSVRRMRSGQIFEVATPTLAFTINRAGRYRIDVDPRNPVTTVVVWEGAGEAYGDNSSFRLSAGDTVRFYDTDLRDYDIYGLPREDDFDRYCLDRDRRLDHSASLRYLDDDVVGYADLDEYGSWRPVKSYGNVWFPSRVDANWAPYREGHWVWQEPWGWTWVDDASWGFAPSHYGRWVNVSNRWGWVPGPRNARPVYAPALVAFVGGSGWSVSISLGGGSPIGWFPLGPREVYVPSYQASRDYFKRVNVNNTVISNTTITNVYNNYSSGTINVGQANYANRTVAGAVTAVPRSVFVNAQPVRQAAIRLDHKAVTTGEITRGAPVAPSERSVIGAGKAAGAHPSREAFDRQVYVRNAPPPGERPFAAREQQLQKSPGRALEPGAVKPMPDRDNAAQKVRVIGEQPGAVDARAAGSRRVVGKPGTPAAAPGKLQPLDRSVEPAKASVPVPGVNSRDNVQKGQRDVQQQQAAEKQKQQAVDKQQQQAVEKQQQDQRQRDVQQQQAADKQQAERKRQVETQQQQEQQQKQRDAQQQQQQAADKQQAERKRQAETQQQQEQQQKQRDVQQQQQAAEKQQAERKRQAETQQQQEQQQKQRDVQQQQQAAEKQQAERKRQAETQQQQEQQQKQRDVQQQQQAAEKQQAERKRQAETQQQQEQQQKQRDVQQQQQQAVEKQQAERKRQAETQQQQEQQQKQRDVQQQQQAAEKQQAERKRPDQTQQERQAECERQAIQQHQDVSQCKSENPSKDQPGNSNRDKNGK